MEAHGLKEGFVQRCRNVWWTVYVLDRQMSSLMGLPLAIQDEDISAAIPTFPGSPQKTLAIKIHVKLSRVLSQILNSMSKSNRYHLILSADVVVVQAVYGVDGRLNKRFMASTKAALNNIANVTDELKTSFDISSNTSMAGISRLSAYLHLLHHQVRLPNPIYHRNVLLSTNSLPLLFPSPTI